MFYIDWRGCEGDERDEEGDREGARWEPLKKACTDLRALELTTSSLKKLKRNSHAPEDTARTIYLPITGRRIVGGGERAGVRTRVGDVLGFGISEWPGRTRWKVTVSLQREKISVDGTDGIGSLMVEEDKGA
ncbi:hypothetical protein BY996DRAFT_6411624 [Phakopsora pachyrhizi]|nr:hypothetical protein BY996DRAFT_6411624 [Phakopsora pachyrhizi]